MFLILYFVSLNKDIHFCVFYTLFSFELRNWVAVSFESSIDNIRSLIMKIWHDWLVHWAIPWDISNLSGSISVSTFMVLMENWSLSSSPLFVSIWNWWVSWKNSGQIPPEEVWIVQQITVEVLVVVEDDWSLESKTSSETLSNEEINIKVWNTGSPVEALDWKFSNYCKT